VAAFIRSGRIALVWFTVVGAACSQAAEPSESSSGTPQVTVPVAPATVQSSTTAVAGQPAVVTGSPQPMASAAGTGGPELPISPDSTPAQPPAIASSDAFCGVLEVMAASCQQCHGAKPIGGAPMSLVTFEDFMKPAPSNAARKVYELVQERTHDQKRPMPPPGILPADKLAALDAWLQAGATQPTAACPVIEVPSTEATAQPWPPADCEDVYSILAYDPADKTKPYTIPGNSEEHPQMSFDAPWGDDDVQLLATRPITQNPELIHHWILWDAIQRANLTFWAPGAGGDVLPPDVGLYVPKGPASLSLDMHYYNKNSAEPVQDQSGLEVCITRTFRPKTAAIYGLRGNATVPAMQRAENAVPCTATTTSGDVHFLAITPHMHRLGVHAHLDLKRGSDPMNVIYDAPYNFEEQTLKPLGDVVVKNGDVLTTTCTYQNDTTRDIVWGDATEDEMCFNWMRYYPRGGFTCLPTGGGRGAIPGLPGGLPGLPMP
jgi:hypothetical protein